MSGLKDYKKKVQPSDKSFSSMTTDTTALEPPNSRGSDPSNVIISPTRSTAKVSVQKPKDNMINLLSIPETSQTKSLEGNNQPQFLSIVFKKPGASILRKSRIGSEAQKKPETKEAIKAPKKRKLMFKDALEEVNIVENWKEYNTDGTYNQSATCFCSTF